MKGNTTKAVLDTDAELTNISARTHMKVDFYVKNHLIIINFTINVILLITRFILRLN